MAPKVTIYILFGLFVRIFLTKNFQKSPNLVSLLSSLTLLWALSLLPNCMSSQQSSISLHLYTYKSTSICPLSLSIYLSCSLFHWLSIYLYLGRPNLTCRSLSLTTYLSTSLDIQRYFHLSCLSLHFSLSFFLSLSLWDFLSVFISLSLSLPISLHLSTYKCT